jgi:hypothetical protein
MTTTTFEDSQRQFEQPFEQPSASEKTTDTPKAEDTKSAIARLREEIRIATSELQLSEATLATAKATLGGTT